VLDPLALRQKVDAMFAYLARPPSEPLRVISLLASSTDGRFVVLLSQEQVPLLYDAQADSTTPLAEEDLDLRADGLRGAFRSVAFSPDGSRLAILSRGQSPRVTLWELPRGSKTTVAPVGTKIWRVGFDASGEYVVLQEVLDDTNKNGRLDWPIPERPLRNTQCSAMIGALDAWVPTGDTAVTTIASVKGGKAKRVDGFIAALGTNLVTKNAGEPLVVSSPGGTKRISAIDCDARVIAVSGRFGQILTSCSDKNGHPVLELSSLRGSRKYEYEVPTSFTDWTEPEVSRFRALYAGVHTYLVDFRLAQVSPMQERDQLLAQGDAGVIIRRANQVLLVNPDSGRSEVLLEDVRSGARIVLGPGHVQVGQDLISATHGKKLGRVELPSVFVSSNGCALVARGRRADGDALLTGPLQWICPGTDARP
jgi:WD40 repeat protein